MLRYVSRGLDAGAELVTGGHAVDRPGYFVEPTVFVNTAPDSAFVQEEVFGPVLAAMPFDGLNDVGRLANATNYGLGAGIFTRDLSQAHLAAKRIRAGTVG